MCTLGGLFTNAQVINNIMTGPYKSLYNPENVYRNEAGGGVSGGGMHEIVYLIKLITLFGETFTSSSSSPHGGEIKGLFSSPLLPLFL